MIDSKDEKIRRFFERCLRCWELRHGRGPATTEEMWEAVTEEMEKMEKGRPS